MMALDQQIQSTQSLPYLLTLGAVRDKSQHILQLAENGELHYFTYDKSATYNVIQYVQRTILENYPTFEIPNHSRLNHFKVGGIDRIKLLNLGGSTTEKAKTLFECLMLSVLLDAGAGQDWRFKEPTTGQIFNRSEGLALASFYAFLNGIFFDKDNAVTATSLQNINLPKFEALFQITASNTLVGLEERLSLIHRLAHILETMPGYFGTHARLGNFTDRLFEEVKDNSLSAEVVFNHLMHAFSELWGYGAILNDKRLGDVWHYSKLGDAYEKSLIPFHKLTQWLCYSVLDLFEILGIHITDQEKLTGLAEYRNGGLFVDCAMIKPKKQNDFLIHHPVNSDLIIEWRALTIALLDNIALTLNQALNLSLPLSKILEGGTWWAGRKIAQEKRPLGDPPIKVRANGITF